MRIFKYILVLIFICYNLFAFEVKFGDTLFGILKSYMSPKDILDISKELKKLDFELKAGQKYEIKNDKIVFHDGIARDIIVDLDTKVVKEVRYSINKLVTVVSGEIEDSLFGAVVKTGEDEILAVRLAEIFEWEIDFFKDIRKGDEFYVVVEKLFCKGKFIGYGKILGADFVNKGRHIRALYYENKYTKGYFTPEGESLKKGFLKAPLKFGRITSTFKYRRLHPVLKVYRPHYGVDYAAPIGTPIHATADGRVVAKSYSKSNGYYVKIKHNNGYYTYYLHMSKFKKGLKVGSYVRQGDVIGYVGMTGYASGPHVDYRIKKNGRWINPLHFKSPSKKLSKNMIADFLAKTNYVASLLDSSYYKFAKLFITR
ncbi:peptidoglycan DD-metalloendopeptidase family protein [Deferribacter thermophilus]|uniref:peptidoglycan DD-metalloendopeptidase family protein n=1 Tax=Deferribacter thermophilus TaxID=53573 RepID=UPI003C1E265A